MLKKLFAALLVAAGFGAAASAADRVELIVFVNGADAKLAVEEKSENLSAGKITTIDYKGLKGKKQVFTVLFDDNGRAKISLKINTFSDRFCSVRVYGYSGAGKKPVEIPVACTALTLDGKTLIPRGKIKAKRFKKEDALLFPSVKFEGERTIEFAADLVKAAAKKAAPAAE